MDVQGGYEYGDGWCGFELCYMFVSGCLVFGISGQQFAHASIYFV